MGFEKYFEFLAIICTSFKAIKRFVLALSGKRKALSCVLVGPIVHRLNVPTGLPNKSDDTIWIGNSRCTNSFL